MTATSLTGNPPDVTPLSATPADETATPSDHETDRDLRPAGPSMNRGSGGLRRLWRGPIDDPSWARPALLALLLATAGAYLWNLTASGWANQFYSAAAQAGSVSWSAFFFGSLDAANSITVDKPPAALWVMALSVRVFGLSSFAILLPQVIMGVAAVAVVHAAVKRGFGAVAGLLAGLVLALTPVAVLMFRFNNPDALLTLLMAAGAYTTLRAVERGSIRWMALTGVLIGLGFLTKTLQVMLVVPAFGLAYLLLANAPLRRRLLGSAVGLAAMVLSAGWWVAIVELLPADARPYIGGSQTNSFLELTFGYNGFGRLNGSEVGSVGGGQRGPNSGGGTLLRLFESSVAGQISWLVPAAVLLLVAGLVWRARAPRTDLRRAAYVVWGGWLLVTGLTFSLMAGIFHEYYTVTLAPAVAALVGMGAVEAWERRARWSGRVALAVACLVTALWSFLLLSETSSYGPLRFVVLVAGIVAALLLLAAHRLHATVIGGAAALALAAALAGPAAFSASTLATAHTGSIVLAGPADLSRGGGMPGARGRLGSQGQAGAFPGGMPGGMPGGGQAPGGMPGGGPNGLPGGGQASGGMPGGGPGAGSRTPGTGSDGRGGMGGLLQGTSPSTEVVTALSADADQFTWVAAAVGSQNAAGLQLGTQLPVMAVGGFNGSDPSPTLAQFQGYVADGQIHYFLAGGGFRGQNGGSDAASQIAAWVSENFTQVTIGSDTFYDLTQPLVSGSVGDQV